MEYFESVKQFIQDFGMWSILIVLLAKFLSGVLVAIDKNEFKWFYLGNIFKSDLLKVATVALVMGLGKFSGVPEFSNDYMQFGAGSLLFADLVAGVLKNVAHLLPSVAEAVPSSVREPAKLRLGNPRNLP